MWNIFNSPKMNLVIFNLLVVVAFCQESNGQEQPELAALFEPYAGALGFVNCTGRSGNVCSSNETDCGSVFLCIPSMTDPIEGTCINGQTCNAGLCSSIKSALCEYGSRKFKCNTQGMYPEPSSCKKFNYCVPVADTPNTFTHTPANCDDGWGYNPMTASCDTKLLNNNCVATSRVVPACKSFGQNGALTANPTMYYICMAYSATDTELYPNIYKCPGNTRYAGNLACK